MFVLLRAGQPYGFTHSTAEASLMEWTLPFCPLGSSLYPENTQEPATGGSQALGASSHTGSQLPHSPTAGGTLFTNQRKAWVGCGGPASTWELRLDPWGGACWAHSRPGPQTPDQLQATTSARGNVTPSTPAPHGDKYGQRRLLPKKNFNKVPKILCRK